MKCSSRTDSNFALKQLDFLKEVVYTLYGYCDYYENLCETQGALCLDEIGTVIFNG